MKQDRRQINREYARRHCLAYMQYMWQRPEQPFKIGRHTRSIGQILDVALARFRAGYSTFLKIKLPFRHGKSEIISRYFPTKFIGEFPDEEVIVCTYAASLGYQFSRFARRVMDDSRYQEVWPGVELAQTNRSLQEWGIEAHHGMVHYAGIGGSLTGKGGGLLVLDDFVKNREEAESERIRQSRWEAFRDDFMTRGARVRIVAVLGTPWHVDDIFGRIDKEMEEDEKFPRFADVTFPAIDERWKSAENPTGVLFPEMFSAEWYVEMAALLKPYAAAGLLQCRPILRGGNLLKTEVGKNIHFISLSDVPHGLRWVRAWDLASTKKERLKDDPDYTVGTLMSIQPEYNPILKQYAGKLYIADVIRGQWEATERNKRVREAAIKDGPGVEQGIEAYGAYKDAYTQIRLALKGVRNVRPMRLPGDKVAKVSVLEPMFEGGSVYFVKAPWNQVVVEELSGFPNAAHDDIPDTFAVGRKMMYNYLRALRIAL